MSTPSTNRPTKPEAQRAFRQRLAYRYLALVFSLLLASAPSYAQNIGLDLQRIVNQTKAALAIGTASNNPPLDEIVQILAYYGGMPDRAQVKALLSGPALLDHYEGNTPIRAYLIEEGLDTLLLQYTPPADKALLRLLDRPERAEYLKEMDWDDLFTEDEVVDLEKIMATYSTPVAGEFDLSAAATSAKATNLSSKDLVSNALAGLSDWISKRAQEELSYTFLTKLRDDLDRNGLNHLFPHTADFLPELDLLNYKSILPSIREAFIKDLNEITFNLGRYLEQQDPNTFRSPAVYNVFMIYRILELELREVPFTDILAVTFTDLKRARVATRAELDLALASFDQNDAGYRRIQQAFDQYIAEEDQYRRQYRQAMSTLSESFLNPTVNELEKDTVLQPQQKISFINEIRSIYKKPDAVSLSLSEAFKQSEAKYEPIKVVQSWLNGEVPYNYYLAYPSVSKFDELFGTKAKPIPRQKLRAAGLTAVRELLSNHKRNSLTDKTDLLYEALDQMEEAVNQLEEVKKNNQMAQRSVAKKLKDLKENIRLELAYEDAPALQMLQALTNEVLINSATEAEVALLEERFKTWVVQQNDANSPYTKILEETPSVSSGLDVFQEKILQTTTAATKVEEAKNRLAEALTQYNNERTDTLARAYNNLATFESLFALGREVFFLLADASNTDIFLDAKGMSVFSTNRRARQLLSGLGEERVARIPRLGNVNPAGISNFLIDFSYLLSQNRALQARQDTLSKVELRIAYVAFVTNTIEALSQANLFRKEVGEKSINQSLVDRYPSFRNVPVVNRELSELYALSQRGEFRFAIDNLLNLAKIFNIAPTAKGRKKRLEQRQANNLRLLENLLVSESEALSTIGISVDQQKTAKELQKVMPDGVVSQQEKISTLQQRIAHLDGVIKKFDQRKTENFRENFFRYGVFMSEVAAANKPADIEAALNTVALPVGSSQIKRNEPFSLELGAYFGATIGLEELTFPTNVNVSEQAKDPQPTVALWVPVGFTISKNIGGKKSLTAFASILDLGAVTAYRLGEDSPETDGIEVEPLPEFTLSNVLSPGLHLLYNFPKSPFSLGIGRQFGPRVRKFSIDGVENVEGAASDRWLLNFAVDVPVFRLGGK